MNNSERAIKQVANLDKVWHLQQSSLMDGLSPEDLAAVASICTDRFYDKDEVIFERGDPASHLYILFRGCVRSSVCNEEGREKIVAFFKTGDVFGESLLESDRLHQSQALAHEECWIGTLSRLEFANLIRQRLRLAFNFIQVLSNKLGEARADIEALSFLGTQQRLARTLLKMANVHGKSIVAQDSLRKIKFPVSHENLARLIGANRPHVSTIMSDFKKKGWISYQGRKLLINTEALNRGTLPFETELLAS